MFSSLFMGVSLLLALRGSHVSASDNNCRDKPVFTPARLVVKHGDPTSSTCEVCQQDCLPTLGDAYDIEASLGKTAKNGTRVTWTVERMTEWDLTPLCYYTDKDNNQCLSDLAVTVYKPPDYVYMMINHSGPLTEGTEYTLQCSVMNVAPAKDLTVTFYRGQTLLGIRKSSKIAKGTVTEKLYFSFNATRDDHEAQFWCEAKLELGAEGPQPPPALKSEFLKARIHYGPELKVQADPAPVDIIRGETLRLTCVAEANPSPSYNWTLPSNKGHPSQSNLTVQSVDLRDGGLYVCSVSANGKTINVIFEVKVQETYWPFIIGAIVGVVALLIVLGIIYYSFYYKQNKTGKYRVKDVLRMGTVQQTTIPLTS